MARKKVENLDVFDGEVTPRMLILQILAEMPFNFDVRTRLATLQFYTKTTPQMGVRVEGTKSLYISDEMAKLYLK